MVKWLLGLLVAFLVIDHLWVHYGGPFFEKLRADYREDLKKSGIETQDIQIQQEYRKSILDQLLEKLKSALNRESKLEENIKTE